MLAPNGTEWLTKGGRGPEMVLGRNAIEHLNLFAELFPPIADVKAAIVEDAHSVRQILNVASADQRVLVLVNGSKEQLATAQETLKPVASDDRIIGRFHFDFEANNEWRKFITGANDEPGIMLVSPGEFGLQGTVLQQLPLDCPTPELINALLAANSTFANSTAKKVYSEHVSKGQKLGINFEAPVPYGEDRDGDGEIDRGGSNGRSRGPSRR